MRRGSSGRPAPRVTGVIPRCTSSRSPASANWPTRSPPPMTQTSCAVRGRDQLVVHRGDVAGDEPHVDTRDAGQVLVGEHPQRAVAVELGVLLGVLGEVVVEHPAVRRGAGDHRPDPADERVPAAVVLAVRHLEEPVQGVVLVGDEAVEGAGGEVDDPGHARWLRRRLLAPGHVDDPACRVRRRGTRVPSVRRPGRTCYARTGLTELVASWT